MIGNRFNTLYDELKTNQRHFAEAIGYSQATLSRLEAGKISLTKKMKRAISREYPHINVAWLETGKGPMLLEESPSLDEFTVKESGAKYSAIIAGHKVTERELDILIKMLTVLRGKWKGKYEISLHQNIESFYTATLAEQGKNYAADIEGIPPPMGAKRAKHREGGD